MIELSKTVPYTILLAHPLINLIIWWFYLNIPAEYTLTQQKNGFWYLC